MSPLPTALHTFGESVSDDVFCVVELDTKANKNSYGEEVTSFGPGTDVYFLVHIESGAIIDAISSSYGDIANPNTRKTVNRTNTIDLVQFPKTDTEYTVPHIPSGNVSAVWEGFSSNLVRNGRVLKSSQAPRLATISYSYTSYQFRLITDEFSIAEDEDFNILVDLELSK